MMSFPSHPPVRWSLSAIWVSSALLIFMALGVSSLVSWMVLLVSGIPPVVFLSLWNDGPPPTIAEVLRATEDHRWRRESD